MIKNFYGLASACEGINFDSKNKTEDVKLSQASKQARENLLQLRGRIH